MIPAPLLAPVCYLVVYACARLIARGWTIFGFDPDTIDVVVNLVAAAVTGHGMYAATVSRTMARLVARHHAALLDAAAAVPGVIRIEATQLAAATVNPAVVAPAQPGRA